ncbi:hypothetical protein PRIPAC_97038 [Pristionchus pacificus]|uniref:Uncharacterized protein n=1 Tax=Pristionchus pacificus TaxID=54126 RepID=A0A2A6BD46_PRIPA|nr:hypothetical protein PRIPAC_97038 [Pristionchus pacificus]|eukprot:PDM63805.1 hypothetical protein PRIPAC_49778 [Pristionchus pacificus]
MLLLRSLSHVVLTALLSCSRANDDPFRMCGTKLLQHVMDRNLCDPNAPQCKELFLATEIFNSRARRGADSKLISAMCCTNMCRPSEIQKVCCGN